MIVFTSQPSARSASACSSACSTTPPQKDQEYGTTMPTFIGGIIVGCVRAFALAAVLVAAAGCGGRGQHWPDCLRILGATHVRVASAAELAKSPKVFAAERAAAIDFSDDVEATIVVSRTPAAAAKTAAALTSIPSVISLPRPTTLPQPSAVLRHGTVVLQWFGRRQPGRQHVLFDCATE
jgi:hypothetical protein